ncbi:MAG: DinB family protein [Promethearchaeota archaeon]
MEDLMVKILKDSFMGKSAHYNSLAALKGLSAKEARRKPSKEARSVWENLYHIVFWHNIILEVAQGAEVDWKALEGRDWPDADKMNIDSEWEVLCRAFALAIEQAQDLLENLSLTKPTPGWADGTVAKAMVVLAQHNSYHLGQIVMARRMLGKWPPPEEPKIGGSED